MIFRSTVTQGGRNSVFTESLTCVAGSRVGEQGLLGFPLTRVAQSMSGRQIDGTNWSVIQDLSWLYVSLAFFFLRLQFSVYFFYFFFSLFLYLSVSPYPSLPPSLSPFLSPSLSLLSSLPPTISFIPSHYLSLSLSFSLSLSHYIVFFNSYPLSYFLFQPVLHNWCN